MEEQEGVAEEPQEEAEVSPIEAAGNKTYHLLELWSAERILTFAKSW